MLLLNVEVHLLRILVCPNPNFSELLLFSFSFLTSWNWNDNAFIHFRSFLEYNARFRIKMGKVYSRFQTKTTQKPSPLGAAGAYITSTAFPPLPGVHSSVKFCHHVLPWYLTHRLSLGHLIFVVQKMNQNIVFFFLWIGVFLETTSFCENFNPDKIRTWYKNTWTVSTSLLWFRFHL